MHFVDFLSMIICCDHFTRIQELVVYDSTCQTPNIDRNRFHTQQLWFVLVPNFGSYTKRNANSCTTETSAIVLVALKKRRADIATAIFFRFVLFVQHSFIGLFYFPFWWKHRTTAILVAVFYRRLPLLCSLYLWGNIGTNIELYVHW